MKNNKISFKKNAKEGDVILTAKEQIFYILLVEKKNHFISYSRWNGKLWDISKDAGNIKYFKPGCWQFIGHTWEPEDGRYK